MAPKTDTLGRSKAYTDVVRIYKESRREVQQEILNHNALLIKFHIFNLQPLRYLLIGEKFSWLNGTLRYHGNTVHPWTSGLEHSVPVEGDRLIAHVIVHTYANLITKNTRPYKGQIWSICFNFLIQRTKHTLGWNLTTLIPFLFFFYSFHSSLCKRWKCLCRNIYFTKMNWSVTIYEMLTLPLVDHGRPRLVPETGCWWQTWICNCHLPSVLPPILKKKTKNV